MTPADRARYEAWLVTAEKAYLDLQTGGGVRAFNDQNGERIEYSAANSSKLLQTINGIRSMLGLCPFIPYATVPPAQVFF